MHHSSTVSPRAVSAVVPRLRKSGLSPVSARGVACLALLALGGAGACTTPEPRGPAPVAVDSDARLIPARLRRLSNAEYEAAASALVGQPLEIQQLLPPDVRQEGFTVNAAAAVPAAQATRLSQIADQVAADASHKHLTELVPCAGAPNQACTDSFIKDFSRRAFRRPPRPDELRALGTLFHSGQTDGGGFAGGVEWVLSALLQSPSFLYLSELGEPSSAGRRQLSSLEMGASLAFVVSGGPPDEELLRLAEQDRLTDPDIREQQARRLLGKDSTRHHFRRFVLEWLEVDRLEQTAKDEEISPRFEQLKPHMLAETRAFVDEVMVHEGASIRALLSGGFASVDPTMARYYGLKAYGPRVSLDGTARRGLLQQASFLAAHAHEDFSSPVKRGDFVMRKLLCTTLPRPQELNIEVTIPAPNPSQTTRERFSEHVVNTSCRACHASIDALGFTFENFDAAGHERQRQNEKPIVTRATADIDGQPMSFEDSVELTNWLAQNEATHECFARHAFRYFSAQSDPAIERYFLALNRQLPKANDRESLVELVVAYVRSDLFSLREDTP